MIDLRLGDCLEVLATLDARSVDAVITDPPYANTGTGSSRFSTSASIPNETQFFDLWMRQVWAELARVLKPTGAAFMTIDWRGAMACERAAGVVAAQNGYRFIGIEREPEFYELSQRRIAAAQVYGRQPGLFDG